MLCSNSISSYQSPVSTTHELVYSSSKLTAIYTPNPEFPLIKKTQFLNSNFISIFSKQNTKIQFKQKKTENKNAPNSIKMVETNRNLGIQKELT